MRLFPLITRPFVWPRCRIAVWAILLWGVGLVSPLLAQTPSAAEEVEWELQPYRVRVAVAFANEPRFTATYRRQVLQQLHAAIERSTGGQWIFQVEETTKIVPANSLGLKNLSAEKFRSLTENPQNDEPVSPPKFDKQFLLTVNGNGSQYEVAGREWDEQTQELSDISQAVTYERRAVAEELFRRVSDLFHPLLAVEDVDIARNFLMLKLKAGAYVPLDVAADPDAEKLRVQIRKGTLLIAFFRYHNKNGSVRQVQFLPWTYLVVDSVERGRVTANLVTGIRTPLGAKTSKRVHSLAVAREVEYPATTLQIQLRKNPDKKLAGHYITATVEKYPDEENPAPELFKRITDRLGRLEIPVIAEHDILWLRIHSGDTLLALVPFAPGLEPKIVLDLPDDSIRLAVEGDLTQVRADLIDTVARRAALMIRARKAIAKKDWKAVDEEMANLDNLPSLAEFRQRINNVRIAAARDAEQQQSRLTKRRVDQMCDEAITLVEKYLSEDRINLLKQEIRDSRGK